MSDWSDDLQLARELAHLAEREILPRYRQATVDIKPDGSEVTDADRNAERVIREALAVKRPRDAVLGEEYGGSLVGGRCWVVDPVDGTAWFTLGMPLFGTLVALVVDHEPVLGVIHMPVTGETVYAARGHGCYFVAPGLVAQPVRVSAQAALSDCIGSASGLHATNDAPMTGQPQWRVASLVARTRKFRFCGDCGQHGLVARGRLHFAIDTVMKPWDIAALVPCVEEAGGVVSSLSGERRDILVAGSLLSAATGGVRDTVLAAIAP